MSIGWIKLHRQIQDCCIWQSNEPFDKRSAWIDLLLSANHSDKKIVFNGKAVVIKRGQYLTSIRKLSTKWRWSVNKTYRFIKLLEDEKMLQKESDKDRTLITIENYGLYQDGENTNEYTNENSDENANENTNEYTDRTQTNTQTEHKQEYKNDNNDKEEKNGRMKEDTPPISPSKAETEDKGNTKKKTTKASNPKVFYPNDEKLNQAFLDFMAMRNSIKKPMTDRAITMAMNKLEKLSTIPFSDSMDNDLAIKILEQSTFACWTDLYALKEDRKKSQSSSSLVDEWRNA